MTQHSIPAVLDRLLTPHEVAETLQIPPTTLYQWRHQGKGPRAARIGKHLRYRATDLEAWVTEQVEEAR